MLTLRQRILFIVGGAVTVIALIVLVIVLSDEETINVNNNNVVKPIENVQNNAVNDSHNVSDQQKPLSDIDPEENYVKQLAKIFVERFASYSNQNNNSHIEEVLEISTPSLNDWIKTQKVDFSENYKGVTTDVFSALVTEYGLDKAIVEVGVRQINATASNNGTSGEETQRKGKVELVKLNGEWKINGFWWNKN